jgi:hypothetical protein
MRTHKLQLATLGNTAAATSTSRTAPTPSSRVLRCLLLVATSGGCDGCYCYPSGYLCRIAHITNPRTHV